MPLPAAAAPDPARPSRRLLAGALASVLLAGCPRARTPFDDPDALVVAVHSGFTEQVVASAAGWRAEHPGVKVSLAPYRPRDFSLAILPRLQFGTDVPDVVVVDAAFLAANGRNGTLEDLAAAPYSAAPLLDGVPDAVRAQAHAGSPLPSSAARSEGSSGASALAAVPADVAPLVLFYRKDLLDQAGVSEAELTASWEGFVAACGKLRRATRTYCVPQLAELADAVLRADLPAGRSPFFSESGEPLADEPRFARAFALARAAHQADIDAGTASGSEPWVELVRRGYFAVQLGGPTTVRRVERLLPSSAGKWRAAPLPGGARLSATSAFCALSARGQRKARAWDFVRSACLGKDAQLDAWRTAGALPSSKAAAAAPALDEPVPFLGGQRVGAAWREAAARLPVPGANRLDPYARDAVMLELDYVVQEGKDFSAALAEARARVRREMEKLDGRR